MKLELVPVLSAMEELYNQPISVERFQTYIAKLQGATKGNLELPIGGFNPMAKEHVLHKIKELQELNAEDLVKDLIEKWNGENKAQERTVIRVVLNLADDKKGAWTNFYTTDFDSKFKINALVNRSFCTPYFWTSENFTESLIKRRTLAYIYRTIYWKNNTRLKVLQNYLEQEVFVNQHLNWEGESFDEKDFQGISQFYQENKDSDNYSTIFNFFYGDVVSKSLEYPQFGIGDITGFEYAKFIAAKKKKRI